MKTKSLFFILLLLYCYQNLFAQEQYSVVMIRGAIRKLPNRQLLKPKMNILSIDTLIFESEDAAAYLVGRKKGGFVIKPRMNNPKNNKFEKPLNSLKALVNDYLKLSIKNSSSRSSGFRNRIDFVNYFSDPVIVIGDTLKLNVSKDSYPMSDSTFFFISYTYNGDIINKKLEFISEYLLLSKSQIFMIDGVPINSEKCTNLKLFYYNQNMGTSDPMAEIRLEFLGSKDIKLIVDNYLSIVGTVLSKSELKEKLIEILNNICGKPDEKNLENWLLNNY